MIERITVIGAGSTGHMVAAVMAMRGFKVTLADHERFSDALDAVKEIGFITLRGGARGIGAPEKVTTDPAEAIPGAEAIFVDVPADRHEEIARWIAPYIEDGQHILIIPGNLGSFIFRRVFQELGISAKVTLTEKEGNFGPCRLSGRAEVTTGNPLKFTGQVASLPASDTEEVIKALEGVVSYTANKNVFEGVINSGNVLNHIAPTILAAAEIEHKGKEFSLFKYAFTPASAHCASKIRDERKAVIDAMGMTERSSPLIVYKKTQDLDSYPGFRNFYENMDGPDRLDHRYLHEDCGCGGAFAVSVGKRLGLELPVLSAFLVVAGAINDRDYLGKDGRTLENLGFPEDMTLEEIYQQI